MQNTIKSIIEQFKNIHFGQNWFGQSYKVKLADLDDSLYFERPQANVHSVAELIAHGTAWRSDAVLKITTGKGELTEASEKDWPSLDQLRQKGWDAIYKDYTDSVDSFIRSLEEKEDAFLNEEYTDPEFDGVFPYSFTIIGIVQHDLYHLGQLGLVARMLIR